VHEGIERRRRCRSPRCSVLTPPLIMRCAAAFPVGDIVLMAHIIKHDGAHLPSSRTFSRPPILPPQREGIDLLNPYPVEDGRNDSMVAVE
jgi:hypothetical protein